MLLNRFDGTPIAGRPISLPPDDLTYPTDHADEHAAEVKFLTALPRHEPGRLLLTEGFSKKSDEMVPLQSALHRFA
jgi:hypothetical protein